jgi:hypothetical protein
MSSSVVHVSGPLFTPSPDAVKARTFEKCNQIKFN